MAYDPTVWKSGDTITSAKLNKLENGLAEASGGGTGGVTNVGLTFNDKTKTMNKTWSEINEAFINGLVYCNSYDNGGGLWLVVASANSGGVYATVALPLYMRNADAVVFTTDSENGYPTITEE